PPRGATEDSALPPPESVGATLRAFSRNFAYIGTVLGSAAYTFALGGFAFWMPEYLARVRGVELSRANFIVGTVTVVSGLGGTFRRFTCLAMRSRRTLLGSLQMSADSIERS